MWRDNEAGRDRAALTDQFVERRSPAAARALGGGRGAAWRPPASSVKPALPSAGKRTSWSIVAVANAPALYLSSLVGGSVSRAGAPRRSRRRSPRAVRQRSAGRTG